MILNLITYYLHKALVADTNYVDILTICANWIDKFDVHDNV